MTLEYRCSNCGTLLQTTNADPLDAEIERLRSALKPLAAIPLWSDSYPDCDSDFIEVDNLHLHFTVEQIKAARAARANEQGEALQKDSDDD